MANLGIAVDDVTMASVVAALGSNQRPVAIDRARIDRQIRELALEHAAGGLGDETYPTRLKALREQRDAITERTAAGLPGHRAVRLTAAAYAHGLALALPEKVVVARPTGVGHALTAYELPIEGRDEWLAAARRLA